MPRPEVSVTVTDARNPNVTVLAYADGAWVVWRHDGWGPGSPSVPGPRRGSVTPTFPASPSPSTGLCWCITLFTSPRSEGSLRSPGFLDF